MKYGSVYTTNSLADFVVSLLKVERASARTPSFGVCLDPACGGSSLLNAVARGDVRHSLLYGVDVDPEAIEISRTYSEIIGSEIIYKDFLRPSAKTDPKAYWLERLARVDTIIANPPWSSDRIYDRDELLLRGYKNVDGQYDCYALFVELSMAILHANGFAAFILPDSLFSATAYGLRRFIATKYEIKVIARLGEKLFEGVHRATTVVVVRKCIPSDASLTKCFRLTTSDRKAVLGGDKTLETVFEEQYRVKRQMDFLRNEDCLFDIDVASEDHAVIERIRSHGGKWSFDVSFHRGVEISKRGTVFYCPKCGGANTAALFSGLALKRCKCCGRQVEVSSSELESVMQFRPADGFVPIFVGESVGRYSLSCQRYLKLGVEGINYKDLDDYKPMKILVRKTGLGIKSVVDDSGRMVNQAVYFFTAGEGLREDALYFYNALLNSRVIFYYYMKLYGENEWKSHPYLTKRILQELPIIRFDNKSELHHQIADGARKLNLHYTAAIDAELELLVTLAYGLDRKEVERIKHEMAELPDLGALREMKQ